MKTALVAFFGCLAVGATEAVGRFEFSRAGYWETPGSPRRVTGFNLGWEFSLDGFKTCKAVSLPHGIDEGELLPQASGCVNRQQAAWYRKRFTWHRTSAKSFLHFEAVMGKCRVTVNGRLAAASSSRSSVKMKSSPRRATLSTSARHVPPS